MMLWLPMLLAGVAAEVLATTIIPRDVKLTLRRFDVATGAEVWHSREFTNVRPTHMELFRGRVVVYLRSMKPASGEFSLYSRPEDSRVLFFDSASGKETPPFDTRDFVRTRDDGLLAVSPDGYSSMLDERNELYLSNGWKSYGIKRLDWDGVPTIHFFQAGSSQNSIGTWKLVWTWTRPEGTQSITSWDSNILYIQYRMQNDTGVETLTTIRAGSENPVWKFELPAEVPTLEYFPLPPDVPQKRRGFDYAVGEKSIFVFGNGFVFALDPETGAVKRKLDLNSTVVLKSASIKLQWATVQSASDDNALVLGSEIEQPNVLVNVVWKPTATVQILRRDLLDGRSAIAHGGSIYCFTAEELPEHRRRVAPKL